jgi:hypothetical protein
MAAPRGALAAEQETNHRLRAEESSSSAVLRPPESPESRSGEAAVQAWLYSCPMVNFPKALGVFRSPMWRRRIAICWCARFSAWLAGALFCAEARGQNAPSANAGGESAPQKYTVTLNPPHQVGEKYRIVFDTSQEFHLKMVGSIIGIPALHQAENDDSSGHLVANGEVLAVFPNGSIRKLELTVKELSATAEGKTVPGLPGAGAKIVAEAPDRSAFPRPPPSGETKVAASGARRNSGTGAPPRGRRNGPRTTIMINDQPASRDARRVLMEMLGVGDWESNSIQDLQPASPVAVGQAWPVNFPLRLGGPQSRSTGSIPGLFSNMTLVGVQGVGAAQTVTVHGTIAGQNVEFPVPPGNGVDSAIVSGACDLVAVIPATRASATEKKDTTIAVSFSAHASKFIVGFGMSGTMEFKETSEITYR